MIIKIFPDKEKAKSMIKLIENREKCTQGIDSERFATIVAENYYEILKELATCLLLLDEIKIVGESAHKELITYLGNYKEIQEYELVFLDDLRIRRNKSQYEGRRIEKEYVQKSRLDKFQELIKKLKILINRRL